MADYNSNEYENLLNENPEFESLVHSLMEDYTFSMRELSHELGNIVTLINSSLQIIESSHPEVKEYKYWNSTTEDVKYMIELLSKLSSFNNGMKLHLESINICQMLTEIINSFITNNDYSHIVFRSDIDNDMPSINADPTKLKQVLINIIKNACEADSHTITIRFNCDNQNILIQISDDGCGIEEERLSHIFKPMVTFKENGTGLGLSICQRIISAHHGHIICSSEINKGSSFTIVLPT